MNSFRKYIHPFGLLCMSNLGNQAPASVSTKPFKQLVKLFAYYTVSQSVALGRGASRCGKTQTVREREVAQEVSEVSVKLKKR